MVALVQPRWCCGSAQPALGARRVALLVALVAPLQVFSASFQMSYGIVTALLLLGLPLADDLHARLAWFRDLPRVTWRWHHTVRAGCCTPRSRPWRSASPRRSSARSPDHVLRIVHAGRVAANLWLIRWRPPSFWPASFRWSADWRFVAGAALANHAAVLLLWTIDVGVNAFVALQARVAARFHAPWLGGFALAALLGAMVLGYARHWRGWQRGYWLPFAIVAATLVLGVTFGAAPA